MQRSNRNPACLAATALMAAAGTMSAAGPPDHEIDPGHLVRSGPTFGDAADLAIPPSPSTLPWCTYQSAGAYDTAARPRFVAVGDFDRNCHLDLAVARFYDDDVLVLYGYGDGSFHSPSTFGAGAHPTCVAIGDVNEDGSPDLVVSNINGSDVSVLLNQGDGQFDPPTNYGVGVWPVSVAIADLDGDLDLDLAVANQDSDDISVLLSTGHGTFSTEGRYGVGNAPQCIAIGDLNGDLYLDLAVANEYTNDVSVLLNAGDGTFADDITYDVGIDPESVTIGDFDGDGDGDLAVANGGSDDVSMLLNAGDGTFAADVTWPAGDLPRCITVGDLDGDLDLDLVTANWFSDDVSVLVNAGDGTFSSHVTHGAGNEPRAVAIGDLDSNHELDLIVVNWESEDVSVLVSDCSSICGGDVDRSGAVDFGDLLAVLGNWGPSPGQKLTADDGEAGDEFGLSVALDGDRAAVGARYAAGRVEQDAGAAYLLRWGGNAWADEQRLTASDGESGDQFGVTLALRGDRLVVGARAEDERGSNAGAAYVFDYYEPMQLWTEDQKLTADDGRAGDYFGFAVAVDGDLALIGAYANDQRGDSAGAAYVFRRYPFIGWVQEQKLTASDAAAGDRFGHNVALEGDWAIVGARTADTQNAVDAGAAYVFWWNGWAWVERQKLTTTVHEDYEYFSHPIALNGSWVLFGSSGIDAAQVFRRRGCTWSWAQMLVARPDGSPGDAFGVGVALGDHELVIGARLDDDTGADAGAAYVFRWNGSWWEKRRKLTAPDGAAGDEFGSAVALGDGRALLGARNHAAAGAAYVAPIEPPGDVDGDGIVGFGDILAILGEWGACP